jgi:hypothetical protein
MSTSALLLCEKCGDIIAPSIRLTSASASASAASPVAFPSHEATGPDRLGSIPRGSGFSSLRNPDHDVDALPARQVALCIDGAAHRYVPYNAPQAASASAPAAPVPLIGPGDVAPAPNHSTADVLNIQVGQLKERSRAVISASAYNVSEFHRLSSLMCAAFWDPSNQTILRNVSRDSRAITRSTVYTLLPDLLAPGRASDLATFMKDTFALGTIIVEMIKVHLKIHTNVPGGDLRSAKVFNGGHLSQEFSTPATVHAWGEMIKDAHRKQTFSAALLGVIPGQEAIDCFDDPRKWAIAALDIPLNGRVGKLLDLALDHLAHRITEAGSVYISDAAWRLDRLRFRQGSASLANTFRRQRFDENAGFLPEEIDPALPDGSASAPGAPSTVHNSGANSQWQAHPGTYNGNRGRTGARGGRGPGRFGGRSGRANSFSNYYNIRGRGRR